MYTSVFIDERVEISAKEMNDVRSMDMLKDMLTAKLKHKEGKCNANGYVKPGSVQLLARSMGVAENGKFTANWIYDCKVSCEVLKPVAYDPKDPSNEAAVLTVKIIKINKMGVYAVFEEAIRVLLPRDLHAGNPAFDVLKENDTVRVQMDKHRFQTNDEYIMSVGTLLSSSEAPGPSRGVPERGAEKGTEKGTERGAENAADAEEEEDAAAADAEEE